MKEEIVISAVSGTSRILLGEKLKNLSAYLPEGKQVVCITDENLLRNYSAELEPWQKVVIGTGEKIKTLKTVHQIYEKLISYEVDRSSFIVAVGGGIVCDVAGFAASTFMRGIPFGFVSTSLLSQVDASAGGKNGVNFEGFKNMIGVFNQPEFVICDYSMLETLPLKEFISGFAEIVKHAAISDAGMFAYLEKNYQRALAHDTEAIHYLIKKSVTIKSTVVEADEREKGERKKLNFGHTFAHSLEKLTGMIHGEAVSIGMVLAARLSEKKGMLSPADVQRLQSLLANLQLPVETTEGPETLFDAMKRDKKREGDSIQFILLNGLGNAVIERLTYKELEGIVHDLR